MFAASTAMTAVVATQSHFGSVWTVVGLLGFIIGIVPIGMIAAIAKADWLAVGLICEGIVLAFSSRLFAAWLSDTAASDARGNKAPATSAGTERVSQSETRLTRFESVFLLELNAYCLTGGIVQRFTLAQPDHDFTISLPPTAPMIQSILIRQGLMSVYWE